MSGFDIAPLGPLSVGRFTPKPDPTAGMDPFKVLSIAGQVAKEKPDPFETLSMAGRIASERARGFWEKAGWQTVGGAKALGDATINIAAGALKLGSGVVGSATNLGQFLTGGAALHPVDAYNQGYGEAQQGLKEAYGTSDPGITDFLRLDRHDTGALSGVAGEAKKQGVSVDDFINRRLEERLGSQRVLGETIGHLASYVAGPGALVGKAGAAAARPLASWAERAALKGAEKVTGKTWEQIAKLPAWQQFLARAPSTYLRDTVSTTAALMAQSYATSKDDQRLDAALATASMAPLMVPITRLGEGLARKAVELGLSPAGKQAMVRALERFNVGELTAKQLDDEIIRLTAPFMRVAGQRVVAPMFESTLLMSADKHMWDLYDRMRSGDAEAGAQLLDIWMGTAAGLAVGKGALPHDMAPLFKTIRPDLNSLRHHLEAQAHRETAKQDQEPVQPKTKEQMVSDLEDFLRTLTEPERQAQAQDDFISERQGAEPADVAQRAMDRWLSKQNVLWAEKQVDNSIKGGWEPTSPAVGELQLTFSPNYSVSVRELPPFANVGSMSGRKPFVIDSAVEAKWPSPKSDVPPKLAELRDVGSMSGGQPAPVDPNLEPRWRGQEPPPEFAVPEWALDPKPDATFTGSGKELDVANKWADIMLSAGSNPDSGVDAFARQQVTRDVDIDVARSLLPHVSQDSVLHTGLKSIVESDAPYGPVVASGLELAVAIKNWRSKRADSSGNSGRVNEWLNQTADDIAHFGMQARYSEGTLAGEVLRKASDAFSLKSFVDAYYPSGADVPASVTIGPREAQLFSTIGVPMKVGTHTGQDAQYVLDSLTMLGQFRQLQGDVAFEKMGLRQVEPGVWADDFSGTHVRMDLDGKVLERDPLTGEGWKVSENQDVDYGVDLNNAVWQNPAQQELATLLLQKQAIAPDTLVDGIITYALAEAQAGNSVGAEQIRVFFDQLGPAVLMEGMKPGADRELAMELGRLATGNDNAEHALQMRAEKQAQEQKPAQQEGQPRDPNEPPMSGEAGAVYVPSPQEIAQKGKEVAMAAVEGARVARTNVTKSQADELADAVPGNKVVERGRYAQARGAQIQGEAGPAIREIRSAIKKGPERLKGSTSTTPKRRIATSTTDASEVWPEAKGLDMRVSVPRMLADKRVEPQGKEEAAFVEGAQKALQGVYETTRQAGTVRTEGGVTNPLRKSEKSVVPYENGKDFQDVMRDNEQRRAYFDDLAKINPHVKVPETKEVPVKGGKPGEMKTVNVKDANGNVVERPITGADLEAHYQKLQEKLALRESGKLEMTDAEVEQATEFSRKMRRPDVWRGKEMLDTNVQRVIDNQVRKQAYRAAEIEAFGQDVSNRDAVIADFRKRLEADPGNKDLQRSLDMLENRPGADAAIKELGDLAASQGMSGPDRGIVMQRARNWIRRIQTEEPVKMGRFLRALRAFGVPTSMIKAWKSGVYDPAEMYLRLATYFPIKDVHAAFAEVFGSKNPRDWPKNVRDAIHMAEDLGAVLRDAGQTLGTESDSWLQRAADKIAVPSTLMEKVKSALFTSAVNRMLTRIKEKRTYDGDKLSLMVDLRLSPEQMRKVEAGDLSGGLEAQIRREYVTFLTNRVTSAEGSRFSANPVTGSLFRFVRFATSRLESNIKTMQAIYKAPPELRGLAARRALVKLIPGLTLSGMFANALSMMLGELFRSGNPANGAKAYWNMLAYAPATTIGKGLWSQSIGGPAASATELALFDYKDVQSWTNMTLPSEIAYNVLKAAHSLADGDWSAPWEFLVNSGLIPGSRDTSNLVALSMAAAMGENLEARSDERMVRQWMRVEGIETGSGPRLKPDEFYDGVIKAVKEIKKAGGSTEVAVEKLREALQVETGESIAASIDARRTISKLKPEQLVKLQDFLNDDAQFERLVARDQMLHNFARFVRKNLEGTQPTEWEAELDRVSQLAARGVNDRWDELKRRAVDETAGRILDEQGEGSMISDFAQRLAAYPEHFPNVFGEKDAQRLARDSSTSSRAYRITRILTKQAREKASAERKERRKDQ